MRSNSSRRRSRKLWIPKRSNLEIEVEDILRSLRYKFEAQYKLFSTRNRLRAVFDFYLTSHNVAVEVNGTFWHSDPREYPDGPQTKKQRRVARSWNKKVRYATQRGIRIIVLWEKDLRDAVDMREYIKAELRNQI